MRDPKKTNLSPVFGGNVLTNTEPKRINSESIAKSDRTTKRTNNEPTANRQRTTSEPTAKLNQR